jgi:hypothetical protein
MDDQKQPEMAMQPAYTYKPSLLGAPWLLRLTPDHLAWNVGRRSGSIGYRDIARIRLSFRPVSMQKRYQAEIWAPGTLKLSIVSTSWKSIMEQESLNKPYSQFVSELHRRIVAAGGRPRCDGGLNPFLYWPGVVVYVVVLLGMAALIVRALQVSSYSGALFVAGFLAVFAWQLGHFFKLNKPGRYEPDAPPQSLLPGL